MVAKKTKGMTNDLDKVLARVNINSLKKMFVNTLIKECKIAMYEKAEDLATKIAESWCDEITKDKKRMDAIMKPIQEGLIKKLREDIKKNASLTIDW